MGRKSISLMTINYRRHIFHFPPTDYSLSAFVTGSPSPPLPSCGICIRQGSNEKEIEDIAKRLNYSSNRFLQCEIIKRIPCSWGALLGRVASAAPRHDCFAVLVCKSGASRSTSVSPHLLKVCKVVSDGEAGGEEKAPSRAGS